MENFVVSARKYRPATFDTVVGQEHITTTLRNAIRTNHLASAFLFCGPRGVGKTTCARILAKTINCQNLTADAEACDQCESCVSFRQNASFNIHELDAASNNSVEDIRNLIDQVRYPPQSGKYKIYIIDEVHMLSSAAFNAFLKTLEEPPTYAIFILATTEKHKILPTILSRCQIFDFNRIQPQHIATHLADIAGKENIGFEPEALELIARKADGGLRDALSMFDLNVTFATDRTLRYKEVLDNLHILDYDYYFSLTDQLLAGDMSQSLLTLDEILRKGFDTHQFVVGLTRHFRDVLVCRDSATVQLLQVTDGVRAKYLDQAVRAPLSFLLSALSIGGQCDMNFKQAKDQRLHTELALLKLAGLRHALNWETMPEGLPVGNGTAVQMQPVVGNGTMAADEKKKPISVNSDPLSVSNDQLSVNNGQSLAAGEQHPITSEPANGYHTNGSRQRPANHQIPATDPGGEPYQSQRGTAPAKPPVPALPANSRLRTTANLNARPTTTTVAQVIEQQRSNLPDKSFDLAELQIVWQAFVKIREAQNDSETERMALNRAFELDGMTIRLALDNKLQEAALNDIKVELMGYVRKELQNRAIQLEHSVVMADVKKLIYSPQDKFNFLANKNPALHDLRKALNLDVDY